MESMKTREQVEGSVEKSFEALLAFVAIIELDAPVFNELCLVFQLFCIH